MIARRDAIIGRTLGITSGLAYGISSVLVSRGVSGLAPPLVGAAVGLLAGTLSLAVVSLWSQRSNGGYDRSSVAFLLISGVFAGLGVLSSFFALSVAPVVIVSPLQSISPMFVMLWSHLFLGQMEKITIRVVLGSILVVIGAILIALGRAS